WLADYFGAIVTAASEPESSPVRCRRERDTAAAQGRLLPSSRRRRTTSPGTAPRAVTRDSSTTRKERPGTGALRAERKSTKAPTLATLVPVPNTEEAWLSEIARAWHDAHEATPFMALARLRVKDEDLFQ